HSPFTFHFTSPLPPSFVVRFHRLSAIGYRLWLCAVSAKPPYARRPSPRIPSPVVPQSIRCRPIQPIHRPTQERHRKSTSHRFLHSGPEAFHSRSKRRRRLLVLRRSAPLSSLPLSKQGQTRPQR